MYGANSGASEQRDRQLQDHGHVDGDAVALADASCLESIGQLADATLQLGECHGIHVIGIVSLPEKGHFVAQSLL